MLADKCTGCVSQFMGLLRYKNVISINNYIYVKTVTKICFEIPFAIFVKYHPTVTIHHDLI
jgi:hypothetical protein